MWHVFRSGKVTINVPALPRISPQIHHKNTTLITTFSAKPPAKTPLTTPEKISQNHNHGSGLAGGVA
jgi:hypothetical protein